VSQDERTISTKDWRQTAFEIARNVVLVDLLALAAVLVFCVVTGRLNAAGFSNALGYTGFFLCAAAGMVGLGGQFHHRTFQQQYSWTMSRWTVQERMLRLARDQERNFSFVWVLLLAGAVLMLLAFIMS
jgi:hypothetical protein